MKKFTRLATVALMAAASLSMSAFEADEITNLYLVGEASQHSWNRGEAPELVQAVDEDEMPTGVFSWTGLLMKGEFKFLIDRNSWDSVNANSENAPLVCDAPLRINFGGDDYKWVVEEAGIYNVVVDINERTLMVTQSDEIYIIGGAVASGWDRGAAPALKLGADGIYRWSGNLSAADFKFLTSRDSWDSLNASDDNYAVVLDSPMKVNYTGYDFKWQIQESGVYNVEVNVPAQELIISKDTSAFVPTKFETKGSALTVVPTHMYGDIYKYIGSVAAGSYKIAATDGETTLWVKVVDNAFKYVKESDATVFTVDEAIEKAHFVINSVLGTVTLKAYTPWTNAWAVGSFGWGFSDDYKFVQDAENEDIFVWEGKLSTADGSEIKFTCADNYDDSENSIHPYVGNQTLGESENFYRGGADLKWLIPEEGWYRITINAYLETIAVERIAEPEPQVIVGDANGDTQINVSDVTSIIDYILGNADGGFVFEGGDINADETINVNDVTGLIDLILNGE